jgi:nuclear receptor subfamily 1 group D protein 3
MSRDAVRFGRVPKREKAKILAAMQSSRMKTQESKVMGELNDDAKIIDCIVRAHYDTCDYTRKKMEPFLQRAKANPKYISCSGTVSLYEYTQVLQKRLDPGRCCHYSLITYSTD